jgi:pimeloyl-ACP methyl ester carboxylesterase
MMAVMRDLEFAVNGMVFTGIASGPDDGDLVLLLHGFPQTCMAWAAQVEALGQAGWRAVAPDIRGFTDGARPGPVSQYTQDLVASDVLAIAAELKTVSFNLAGHDLGGIIAWDVACRYPQYVRTLAVASTPHLTPFAAALDAGQEQRLPPFGLFRQPGTAEHALLDNDAAALRPSYQGLPGELIERYVGYFSRPGVLTAALNHFRAFEFDDWLALPDATMPTLFTWGADDPYLARSTALATRAHVKARYTEKELPGTGHWVPDLAADQVSQLLLQHLRA